MRSESIDMQPPRDQIEELRGEQESLAFWQRRRRFLSVHWNKFPQEELNNLSYCYSSVMVYSCRYPTALMNRLYDLAMEVVDDLQKEKEGKVLPQEIKTKWDEAITEPMTLERIMLNIGEEGGSGLLDNEEDSEENVDDEQLDVEERMRKEREQEGEITSNEMYTETSMSCNKHGQDGEITNNEMYTETSTSRNKHGQEGEITNNEIYTETSTSRNKHGQEGEITNNEMYTETSTSRNKHRQEGEITNYEMYTETSTSRTIEVSAEEESAFNYHCNGEQPSSHIPNPNQNLLRLQTENLSRIMNFSPRPTTTGSASVESQWKFNTPLMNRHINLKTDQHPPRDNNATLKPRATTTPHQNPLLQQQKSLQSGEKQGYHLGDTVSTGSRSNAVVGTCVHKASTTAGKWKQVYNASSSKDMNKKNELCESPHHPLSNESKKMSDKGRGSNAIQDQATGSKKANISRQTGIIPTKLAGKSECVEKTPTVLVGEVKGAKPGNNGTKAKMVTFQAQTSHEKKELTGKRVNAAYKSVWKVHSSSPFEQKHDLPRMQRSNDTKKDELKKSYTMKGLAPQMPDKTLGDKEATKVGRNNNSSKGPQKTLSSTDVNPLVENSKAFSNTQENYTRGPQKRVETVSRVIYSSNFTKPLPPLPSRNRVDVQYKGQVIRKQAPGSYPKSYLPQSQESLNKLKTTERSDKPRRAENGTKSTQGSTGYKPSNSVFKNFLQGLLQKAKKATDC